MKTHAPIASGDYSTPVSQRGQKIARKEPKSAEVARLIEVKKKIKTTWDAISEKIDVPKRTITNYVYESGQLSGAVLRGMLVEYGVSTDWLLMGVGSMYIADTNKANANSKNDEDYANKTAESRSDYLIDKNYPPLFPFLTTLDVNHIQDYFYLTAASIEQSLIQAGDRPGKDYTRMDLYRLAQPFVLEKFNGGELTVSVFETNKGNA